MSRQLDQILVIDLESTCWRDRPPGNETSDIIEVGLCCLDVQALTRVEKRSFLVKPMRSRVSAFCTELTTLRAEDLESAPTLDQVCKTLREDYESRNRMWASYGDYDRRQFERCCRSQNIAYPFGPSHLNVKTLFATSLGLRRPVGMPEALKILGLELEGTHHRGHDDAWNIAAILSKLLKATRNAKTQ